jgi:hypothetical protein
MIPKNITRYHVLKAIKEYDNDPVPKNRQAKKFYIRYEGRVYPAKYLVSLANRYANHTMLSPNDYNGGGETNSFLQMLGFEIIESAANLN